jgi:hypothetical protein
MKNMMTMIIIALGIIAHVSCSAMITVFQKGSNGGSNTQHLTIDGCVEVAERVDLKTRLCIRATDRHARDTIKIQDLIDVQRFMMVKEPGFYLDVPDLISKTYFSDGTFTKDRADALGWKYGSKTFDANGAMIYEHDGLWRSALNYHSHNNIDLLHKQASKNNKKLRVAFSLAKKLEDPNAQKNILELYIPNDRGGARDFTNWVLEETAGRDDWDTAKSLIKANPYGWCSLKHQNNCHITGKIAFRCFVDEENRKKNTELLELATSQPRYSNKDHEHCTIL